MEKSINIRIPGTSANCGPGFDSLGVACTVYDELSLTLVNEERLEITVEGEGAELIPTDERNMVWRSVQTLLRRARADREFPGAVIKMTNHIPISRGLGSSAAAIVGGLKAANVLVGNIFSRRELLQFATEIEGHPDNVAPAIYGGFTVSVTNNGRASSFSFMPRIDLRLVAAIPDFPISTKEARAALPETVTMKDAIFNLSRSSMLVAALMKGNPHFMRHTFDDTLHQPYREKLIPGMRDVFRAGKNEGALGVVISGSGPCLIAYTLGREREIGEAMVEAFRQNGVTAKAITFDIDRRGAHIMKPE